MDKAANKGIIHKNNAARRKSRLMKKMNVKLADYSGSENSNLIPFTQFYLKFIKAGGTHSRFNLVINSKYATKSDVYFIKFWSNIIARIFNV